MHLEHSRSFHTFRVSEISRPSVFQIHIIRLNDCPSLKYDFSHKIVDAVEMPAKMDTSLELREYEARIEELRASEKLLAELNETLEMKLKKTEALRVQRLVIYSECYSMPVANKLDLTLRITVQLN